MFSLKAFAGDGSQSVVIVRSLAVSPTEAFSGGTMGNIMKGKETTKRDTLYEKESPQMSRESL